MLKGKTCSRYYNGIINLLYLSLSAVASSRICRRVKLKILITRGSVDRPSALGKILKLDVNKCDVTFASTKRVY